MPTPGGTITLGDNPKGIAAVNGRLYVTLSNNPRLAIIRVSDNVLEATQLVGPGSVNGHLSVISRDGSRLSDSTPGAVDATTDKVCVVNTRNNNRYAGALTSGPKNPNEGGQEIAVIDNKVYVGNWPGQSASILDDSLCATRRLLTTDTLTGSLHNHRTADTASARTSLLFYCRPVAWMVISHVSSLLSRATHFN